MRVKAVKTISLRGEAQKQAIAAEEDAITIRPKAFKAFAPVTVLLASQ